MYRFPQCEGLWIDARLFISISRELKLIWNWAVCDLVNSPFPCHTVTERSGYSESRTTPRSNERSTGDGEEKRVRHPRKHERPKGNGAALDYDGPSFLTASPEGHAPDPTDAGQIKNRDVIAVTSRSPKATSLGDESIRSAKIIVCVSNDVVKMQRCCAQAACKYIERKHYEWKPQRICP